MSWLCLTIRAARSIVRSVYHVHTCDYIVPNRKEALRPRSSLKVRPSTSLPRRLIRSIKASYFGSSALRQSCVCMQLVLLHAGLGAVGKNVTAICTARKAANVRLSSLLRQISSSKHTSHTDAQLKHVCTDHVDPSESIHRMLPEPQEPGPEDCCQVRCSQDD